MTPTDELARLRAENKALRLACKMAIDPLRKRGRRPKVGPFCETFTGVLEDAERIIDR
jgi:hypothetical protein